MSQVEEDDILDEDEDEEGANDNDTFDVIGLTGRKRSGKDTAGMVFEAAGFKRLAFAMPIKLMIAQLLAYQGVDTETLNRMLEGDLKEIPTPYLAGRSPRYAMQTLGTEWGRDLMASDLWVDVLVNAADQHDLVVITDVRFPNEVAAIKDRLFGDIYRITRPGLEAVDDHPSETQIDSLVVDQEIVNDAPSAQAFADQVAHLLMMGGPSQEDH